MKSSIKVKCFDKYPYFVECECGRKYKNQFHKWYQKHIKICKTPSFFILFKKNIEKEKMECFGG